MDRLEIHFKGYPLTRGLCVPRELLKYWLTEYKVKDKMILLWIE